MQQQRDIICTFCGENTLLLLKPLYDGFTKVGEEQSCSSCGHIYDNPQQVKYASKQENTICLSSEKSESVEIFHDDENKQLCRYCNYYVINPFMQWCSTHKKEVAATDTCASFSPQDSAEQKSS